jgi:3-oxoadipate enol-lactonase
VDTGGHTQAAFPPGDLELPRPDARLRFRDDGAGPTLVLIHGWTLDLEMWNPQVEALSDVFRIIRWDRRGFGLSSGRPSLAADIEDLRALCARLGLRSIAVVGMSQGARIASQLAAESPELVSCLILDGPPAATRKGGIATEEEIPITEYRSLVRELGVEAFRRRWRRHPLIQLRSTDPCTRELLDRMLERYGAADLREPEPAPDLSSPGSVEQPVLVISGEQDLPSRTRSADLLAAALPRCERAVVPAAGHLPNLDNPAFYNALLRRFLQRCTQPHSSQRVSHG